MEYNCVWQQILKRRPIDSTKKYKNATVRFQISSNVAVHYVLQMSTCGGYGMACMEKKNEGMDMNQ